MFFWFSVCYLTVKYIEDNSFFISTMEIKSSINVLVKKCTKKPKIINDSGTVFVSDTHQIKGAISLLPSLSRQTLSIENQTLIRDTYSDIKIEMLNKNFS